MIYEKHTCIKLWTTFITANSLTKIAFHKCIKKIIVGKKNCFNEWDRIGRGRFPWISYRVRSYVVTKNKSFEVHFNNNKLKLNLVNFPHINFCEFKLLLIKDYRSNIITASYGYEFIKPRTLLSKTDRRYLISLHFQSEAPPSSSLYFCLSIVKLSIAL